MSHIPEILEQISFLPMVTSIKILSKNDRSCFVMIFLPAFERRFPFCSTMRRSRDRPPCSKSPSRSWKIPRHSRARVNLLIGRSTTMEAISVARDRDSRRRLCRTQSLSTGIGFGNPSRKAIPFDTGLLTQRKVPAPGSLYVLTLVCNQWQPSCDLCHTKTAGGDVRCRPSRC